MATPLGMDESTTISQGEALQAQREREFARLEQRQRLDQEKVAQRQQRQMQRGRTAASALNNPTQLAQVASGQAYRRGWQYAQEVLEDAALSFADLMIVTGPLAIAMYCLRLLATFNDGFGTVNFRGVRVQRVPGFGFLEGWYRTGKALWIGLVSGLVYALLITSAWVITHPLEAVKEFGFGTVKEFGFGTMWEALKAIGSILTGS